MKDNEVNVVQYDSTQCEIVESGIDSIAHAFEKGSFAEKRSLLLCLDKYLDPYFQYNLPHAPEIFAWLEEEFYRIDNPTIKQEVYELVSWYSDIKLKGYQLDRQGRLKTTKPWWLI